MKAPRFDYAAPRSLDEALALLDERPDETSVLAGGQSLVPLLNLRLARPELVVDLNRVEELAGVERGDSVLRIGAMVRQRRLETDAGVPAILRDATAHIAHVAIRTRGTVGGSLAHADPSAELPAVVTALGGSMVLRRAGGGSRAVAAPAFFQGPLTTAIEPGELLVAVELPVPAPRTGSCFMEVARTHGAFALAGVAALVTLAPDGLVEAASLAFCGLGGEPHVPGWLADTVAGEPPAEALFATVGARVHEEAPGDEHRRRIAGTLAERALTAAAERAGC